MRPVMPLRIKQDAIESLCGKSASVFRGANRRKAYLAFFTTTAPASATAATMTSAATPASPVTGVEEEVPAEEDVPADEDVSVDGVSVPPVCV